MIAIKVWINNSVYLIATQLWWKCMNFDWNFTTIFFRIGCLWKVFIPMLIIKTTNTLQMVELVHKKIYIKRVYTNTSCNNRIKLMCRMYQFSKSSGLIYKILKDWYIFDWINIGWGIGIIACLLVHFQTSMVQPLRLGNWYIIAFHASMCMLLRIHDGIKFKLVKAAPGCFW